ncbi:hypothetical protein GQ55_8G070900 [Panicum hallii var. hallii]|uniref:DUF538 domain-containing protein n=1 Tax=Panicum hallii var. hallii TaxID=1504633 RepID=A0A2T7CLI7_9POAL|nr:hypothetical protein GQ55_8G070900 [Panicum hallii var. hallii]
MAKHNLRHLLPLLFVATVVASPSTASGSSLTSPPATPPIAAPPTANSSTPTAYEMLEQYNLTRGILPEGVTGYVLRPDGSFEVYLPGDCNIHAANMQIKYSSRIAGNIQAQSIRGLEGVKVEMMLVWIGVTQVTRTNDQLNFFAGSISKSFPIGNFANSPHCNS